MSKFLKWLLPDHVNGWSYDWGGRLWKVYMSFFWK